jgi:hypothetical protein
MVAGRTSLRGTQSSLQQHHMRLSQADNKTSTQFTTSTVVGDLDQSSLLIRVTTIPKEKLKSKHDQEAWSKNHVNSHKKKRTILNEIEAFDRTICYCLCV